MTTRLSSFCMETAYAICVYIVSDVVVSGIENGKRSLPRFGESPTPDTIKRTTGNENYLTKLSQGIGNQGLPTR